MTKDILCCLHFHETGAGYDSVFLCKISGTEWSSLHDWSMKNDGCFLLKKLMEEKFPIELERNRVVELNKECQGVDMDSVNKDALSGFAALTLFLNQVTSQENAGALFEEENH